ncbi:MAG TPA: alpha/beta hydrolase [Solirubrobacteraceae bacterium]|jgi:acetyl esterase
MAATLSASDRAQYLLVRGLTGLPDRALRLPAGRPVIVDGQELDVELQLILRLMKLAGDPELDELTVQGARERITQNAAAFAGPTIEVARATDVTVGGADGQLRARLYVPFGAPAAGPLLVYFHGGGFVVGDLDTHDNVCRFLTRQASVGVLSVDYRLAPEHQFPASFDDAVAAFRFVVEHAVDFGADPARIAVAGDSAGGNLAAGVARSAAADGGPAPAFQLLFYPWVDLATEHRSMELFAEGFYLTRRDLHWYRNHYLADPAQATDPRCSPLVAAEPGSVAPAYITTAGFDPLRDEGEDYASRLREAGATVAVRRHPGLIHGFANLGAVNHPSRDALFEATGALRMGLAG